MSKVKNKKRFLFIIGGIIIMLCVICILICINKNNDTNLENENQQENNVIINEAENFKQSKEYKDLVLSNIKFTFKENESFIEGTITNNSNEKLEGILLDVVLLDELKNEKGSIYIYIDEVEAKSSKELTGSIDQNYIDAYDCYIRY